MGGHIGILDVHSSRVVSVRGENDAVVAHEDDRPALHVVRLGRETAQDLRAPHLDVGRWVRAKEHGDRVRFEKFSPYTVSIFDACGFGLVIIPRDCGHGLGASAARSGGRYLTTFGKGVTGFDGMGNEPVCGAFWLSNSTGGT